MGSALKVSASQDRPISSRHSMRHRRSSQVGFLALGLFFSSIVVGLGSFLLLVSGWTHLVAGGISGFLLGSLVTFIPLRDAVKIPEVGVIRLLTASALAKALLLVGATLLCALLPLDLDPRAFALGFAMGYLVLSLAGILFHAWAMRRPQGFPS